MPFLYCRKDYSLTAGKAAWWHRGSVSAICLDAWIHYLRWRMSPFMRQCWGLLHKLAQCTKTHELALELLAFTFDKQHRLFRVLHSLDWNTKLCTAVCIEEANGNYNQQVDMLLNRYQKSIFLQIISLLQCALLLSTFPKSFEGCQVWSLRNVALCFDPR